MHHNSSATKSHERHKPPQKKKVSIFRAAQGSGRPTDLLMVIICTEESVCLLLPPSTEVGVSISIMQKKCMTEHETG